jgi:hypothetical protein
VARLTLDHATPHFTLMSVKEKAVAHAVREARTLRF